MNSPLQAQASTISASSMPEFRRRANRLTPNAYLGQRAYFLTLCTGQRRKLFTRPGLAPTLLAVLRTTCSSHFFNVYAYCFMPDHVHMILTGESESSSLMRLVQEFKSLTSREARKIGLVNFWQKGFYDHTLRTGDSLDAAAWYVFMNPVRAQLAQRAEDWPFSGSFVFEWKSLAAPPEPFAPPWKASPSE
jgi:putative transposase